jgi:membrane-bound lytic murein transglycosylase MltF
VRSFFERYRDAFSALDGEAVAALWHTPSGIAQGDGITWWADASPVRDNMAALCEVYRQADFASTDFELKATQPLGPQFAFADVQWTMRRADDTVLQRFDTAYQLIRTQQGWRVLLCTAYQENLQALREG